MVVLLLSWSSFAATSDRWIANTDGLWSTAANWSSNTPPDPTFSLILVTNAGIKTITLDAATPLLNRSVQKLTVSAPAGSSNTLLLSDLGTNDPLSLTGSLTVGSGGRVVVTNSGLTIDGTLGGILSVPSGTLNLEDGLIDCSSTTASKIGTANASVGTVNLSGGMLGAFQMQLGAASGAQGVLNLSNGVLNCSSLLTLGQAFNSAGILSVSGGHLIATNDLTKVGNLGTGLLALSGGLAQFAFLSTGENSGASGTISVSGGQLIVTPRTTNDLLRIGSMGFGQLNISGGTHVVGSELHLADDLSATGLVYVTGGQLIVTNDLTAIGRYGFGQMVVSNAFVQLTNASVGRHSGAVGVLTVEANGVVTQVDALSIGRFAGSEGHVLVEGGTLALTNDEVWVGREGTGELSVNSGTVAASQFLVGVSPDGTNAPGGTLNLVGGTTVLSSNLVIGTELVSTGHCIMTGGQLAVGSGATGGVLQAVNGEFTMADGTISARELRLTNTFGQFSFNGGLLKLENATVANGLPFTVGNGANPATLDLNGGTFVFANGLVISSNARLTGCGTIIGSIINNGTIATNCGSVIVAPSITQAPVSQSVIQGSNAVFSVTASGSEPLSYQWLFGGADIQGATSSQYIKSNVQVVDAGNYSVVVSNNAGYDISAPATLTVWVPPSIVTPPQNQTVSAGADVVFSVGAAGTGPLSYQWQFGGTDIPGATLSAFTKTAVQAADAGVYSVLVTNVAGSISGSATLTIGGTVAVTIALKARNGWTNTVSLNSVTGSSYLLEFKDSLADPAWTGIPPAVPGTGNQLLLYDPTASGDARYYRVQVQ